jgi:hypothetical protein
MINFEKGISKWTLGSDKNLGFLRQGFNFYYLDSILGHEVKGWLKGLPTRIEATQNEYHEPIA